jgi:hypothetical protein
LRKFTVFGLMMPEHRWHAGFEVPVEKLVTPGRIFCSCYQHVDLFKTATRELGLAFNMDAFAIIQGEKNGESRFYK